MEVLADVKMFMSSSVQEAEALRSALHCSLPLSPIVRSVRHLGSSTPYLSWL